MNTTETLLDNTPTFKPYEQEFEGVQNISTNVNDLSIFCTYSEQGTEYQTNLKEIILSVFDVASYILKNIENQACSTMKLHKLLYYCQAWSLVWDEKPLFDETIEAWANGPVIAKLFYFHKGMFEIKYSDLSIGNLDNITTKQKQTIDKVLEFYGNKSAQWLIDLTHMEEPWKKARTGLSSYERGTNKIELDDIANYYSSL